MSTETRKTLTHGQLIRGKGFPPYTQAITFHTLEGCIADKHGMMTVAGSFARDVAQKRETMWAWSSQAPAVLTADYPGKAEKLAAEQAAIAAAPVLEDGEIVRVGDAEFKVKLIGDRYSDPIAFELVIPPYRHISEAEMA